MSRLKVILLVLMVAVFASALIALVSWTTSSKQIAHMCEAGDADECRELGQEYLYGKKLPKDETKAFAAFTRGCEHGSDYSCVYVADFYTQGRVVPVDFARAFELYTRGCNARIQDGCFGLAVAYRDGHGTSVDKKRARDLFAEVCAHSYSSVGRNVHPSPDDPGCRERDALSDPTPAATAK